MAPLPSAQAEDQAPGSPRAPSPRLVSPPEEQAEGSGQDHDQDMAEASAVPEPNLGTSTIGADSLSDKSPVGPEHLKTQQQQQHSEATPTLETQDPQQQQQ